MQTNINIVSRATTDAEHGSGMPQTQTLGAELASLFKVRSCIEDLVDGSLRGIRIRSLFLRNVGS